MNGGFPVWAIRLNPTLSRPWERPLVGPKTEAAVTQ